MLLYCLVSFLCVSFLAGEVFVNYVDLYDDVDDVLLYYIFEYFMSVFLSSCCLFYLTFLESPDYH